MRDELAAIVSPMLDQLEVPGVGVGVVHAGEVVLAEGFGVRDADGQAPVTARTQFAIGSSTKSFTAAIIGALVDDGLVEWDTPVREYLPWFRMHDPVASERITPRDLLCHRSGLPRHDLTWYGDPDVERAGLVRRVRHLPPNKDFRETWQYNNLMFVTAGYLAGELMGSTWEEAVRDRLLRPLGMRHTNFSVADMRSGDDFSLPHDERDGRVRAIPFRSINLVGPAGSINASVEEMLAFLQANLDGGRYGETQVMSAATIREMQRPQMVLAAGSAFPENVEVAYGLGWFIASYRGHKIVHHGGNIDGFSALVTMAPEAGSGIVILSNRGGSPLRSALSYALFDRLLGLEPLPWGDRFAELLATMKGGQSEARQEQQASAVAGTSPSHELDSYTGEYEHPGYGTLGIAVDGDRLVPSYNNLEFTLEHRHYDVFELSLEGRDEIRATLTFLTDPDGDVSAIAAGFEPSVEPLVFRRLPDARLSDPALLATLARSYTMGQLTVQVNRKGDTGLAIVLPGGTTADLVARWGLRFTLADLPGVKVEFFLAPDGTVDRMVAGPMGVFRPQDTAD